MEYFWILVRVKLPKVLWGMLGVLCVLLIDACIFFIGVNALCEVYDIAFAFKSILHPLMLLVLISIIGSRLFSK